MLSKRCFLFFVVLLFLLATSVGHAQESGDLAYTTKSPEALKFLLTGIDMMDNFRMSEAGPYFEKAVQADPDFAIAYDLWAATATSGQDSWKRINKAVELAPKASEPERLIIMTDKAMFENKMDVARQNMSKLVELLPEDKRVRYYYASFLDGQRDDVEAEKQYNKAISIDPDFAAVYNAYAYFLSRLGRYPEAIKVLQKYAELKPQEPNPHDSMGEIYLWMGDYANSTREYENSLNLKANFVASMAGLGHNHIFKGEYDDARANYSDMRTNALTAGDTTNSYYWEAVSYLYEKKYDDAIRVFKDELSFAKAENNFYLEPDIHMDLAMIYWQKGDFDKALAEVELEREAAMNPKIESSARDGYIRDCLALEAGILARQGKADLAKARLAEYRQAVEGINNPALMRNYHGYAGIVAYFGKDYQASIAELKQSDPDAKLFQYYLGLAYENTGQNDLAKKTFSEIVSFNRNGLAYAIARPAAAEKI